MFLSTLLLIFKIGYLIFYTTKASFLSFSLHFFSACASSYFYHIGSAASFALVGCIFFSISGMAIQISILSFFNYACVCVWVKNCPTLIYLFNIKVLSETPLKCPFCQLASNGLAVLCVLLLFAFVVGSLNIEKGFQLFLAYFVVKMKINLKCTEIK